MSTELLPRGQYERLLDNLEADDWGDTQDGSWRDLGILGTPESIDIDMVDEWD